MNLRKKLSLRMRITLVTGCVVIATSLGITFISMYNVQKQFMSVNLLEESFAALHITPIPSVSAMPSDNDPTSNTTVATTITVDALPAPILDAKKMFDYSSILYLFGVCTLGMAAVYIVAGKALRPVQELNKTVACITSQNLSDRLPEIGTTDEIGGLTHSFNAMLNRLEQSFQQQKHFSANVAHELKTPLATMHAGIQVLHLDEQPTVEECLETLDIAQHNVKRLMDVVENLFLLTDEHKREYADTIPLAELFKDILSELASLYAEKQLKIFCDLQMDTITGSQTLIQRAFFNLVENAMKYSEHGGSVTIRACEGEVSIINTGEGIPEADMNRVFEPFYRVDSSRSRKTGGAGLGLSIVKAIVEKHGWTVKAQSTPTKETVMTVRFHAPFTSDA